MRCGRTLAPGGVLLYATCSILKDENETQVEAFLARTPDAVAEPLDDRFGRVSGAGRQRLPGEHGVRRILLRHGCARQRTGRACPATLANRRRDGAGAGSTAPAIPTSRRRTRRLSSAPCPSPTASRPNWLSDTALFWILAVLVLGAGLGLRDPWPADEPRFALVARQMVESGDWLFPHRGSELYSDKPPMFMWLQAIAYTVLRQLACRLPVAVAAGRAGHAVVRGRSRAPPVDPSRRPVCRLRAAVRAAVHLAGEEGADRSAGGVLDHAGQLRTAAARAAGRAQPRTGLVDVDARLGGRRAGHDQQGRGRHRAVDADAGRHRLAARLGREGARATARSSGSVRSPSCWPRACGWCRC